MKISKTGVTAGPDTFFALVDDFRSWRRWSPHERDDPAVRRTYGGVVKGKGSVYTWESAGAAGSGRAQIVETAFPGSIVVAVDLTRPIAGHLELTFTFERQAGGTTIAAATGGPSGLVTAVMDMFFRGSLSRLSCAAGGENAGLCKVMMRGQ